MSAVNKLFQMEMCRLCRAENSIAEANFPVAVQQIMAQLILPLPCPSGNRDFIRFCLPDGHQTFFCSNFSYQNRKMILFQFTFKSTQIWFQDTLDHCVERRRYGYFFVHTLEI